MYFRPDSRRPAISLFASLSVRREFAIIKLGKSEAISRKAENKKKKKKKYPPRPRAELPSIKRLARMPSPRISVSAGIIRHYRYKLSTRAREISSRIIVDRGLAFGDSPAADRPGRLHEDRLIEPRLFAISKRLRYFFALGSRKATRLARTRRLACLNEAVSVVTSVSEHARALGAKSP